MCVCALPRMLDPRGEVLPPEPPGCLRWTFNLNLFYIFFEVVSKGQLV